MADIHAHDSRRNNFSDHCNPPLQGMEHTLTIASCDPTSCVREGADTDWRAVVDGRCNLLAIALGINTPKGRHRGHV